MSQRSTQEELGIKSNLIYHEWRFLVRYVTPIAIFVVFVSLTGVLDFIF
jgi:neurotransmitter:Na+ symporter, NSS family